MNYKNFTMIIASDAQFPWFEVDKHILHRPDDFKKRFNGMSFDQKVLKTNKDQVAAMNLMRSIQLNWPSNFNEGNSIDRPIAVIMNGDLTAFFHKGEIDHYKLYYERNLTLPIFPGLGNHDYQNNVDGSAAPLKKQQHANRGVNYMRHAIAKNGVSNFYTDAIDDFDPGSLSYSFVIGDYHFVQLHNYLGYVEPKIHIKDSTQWLKQNLQRASALKRKIVLNIHNVDSSQDLKSIIGSHQVVAIFTGHIHWSYGKINCLDHIPIFRSGSTQFNTFLLVQFSEYDMDVATIDARDGLVNFYDPHSSNHLISIILTRHHHHRRIAEVTGPSPTDQMKFMIMAFI
jgi:hypothetical protein